MSSWPLSAVVFVGLGAALTVVGLALALLGSFAYLAALAVGAFFIAAGLVSHASKTTRGRVAGVLIVVGITLLIFGSVMSKLAAVGLGVIAGGLVLALFGLVRRTSPERR